MARNLRGGEGLRASRVGTRTEEDPMSGIANIADAMLVFACGLIIALVSYWNIDLQASTELDTDSLQEVADPEELSEDMLSGGSSYIERGTVYQDPETGTYYVVTDDGTLQEDASNSSGDGSSGSSSSSSVAAPDRSAGAD